MNNIKTIIFDADDTLWDNEIYFRESEHQYCELLKDYMTEDEIMPILYETELKNLALYGYGVKSFMMSTLETLGYITKDQAPYSLVKAVMDIGREQLERPVTLIDGVEDVLQKLQNRYTVVLATKGDLLDQKRKLKKSNLNRYFDHVEIMTDKQKEDYSHLFRQIGGSSEQTMMVGNSLKSDVLPVLEMGGWGVHIPYHTTWQHEMVDGEVKHEKFRELKNIKELPNLLNIQ